MMLDVPFGANHCVRLDVCFAEGATGSLCAEDFVVCKLNSLRKVTQRLQKRPQLRFTVGNRVAFLTCQGLMVQTGHGAGTPARSTRYGNNRSAWQRESRCHTPWPLTLRAEVTSRRK